MLYISGGSGVDSIGNSGNYVSINGGIDSDIIGLSGSVTAATVNVADGDDTIQVLDTQVASFTVENFSLSDIIEFDNNVAIVDSLAGSILVSVEGQDTNVTIGGLSWSKEGIMWNAPVETRTTLAATSLSGAYADGNQILYREYFTSAPLVILEGIKDIAGMDVDNSKVVTLGATNFGTTNSEQVSVISNDGEYTFYLNKDIKNFNKFYGLSATADTINNAANNIRIFAGGGSNVVTSTGYHGSIVSGDDNDFISLSGTTSKNNTVIAGAGDDSIVAISNNNKIDAGAGNNLITIGGAQGNSINVTEGNDTIFVTADVDSFTVAGFSVNDVITFTDKAEIIGTIAGGGISVAVEGGKTVSIYGLSWSETGDMWSLMGSQATLAATTLTGAYVMDDDNKSITFRYGSMSDAQVVLDGITDVSEFSTLSTDKVVSLNAAGFSDAVHVLQNNVNAIFSLSGIVQDGSAQTPSSTTLTACQSSERAAQIQSSTTATMFRLTAAKTTTPLPTSAQELLWSVTQVMIISSTAQAA